MVFSSNKPIKICPICKTEIRNLANHIANKHPSEFARMENYNTPLDNSIITSKEENTPPLNNTLSRGQNFRDILNEKLDQMLSIKVIQMLEKGASLQDIQTIINPPQQKGISLEDLKTYKELFVQNTQTPLNVNIPTESDNSSEWLSLINNALPIVKEMLPKKNAEVQQDDKYRSNKDGSVSDNREIQQEITRNTIQSDCTSQESNLIIRTEQENN